MKNQLKQKYGLPTAIAMVVGIVIGSGVFFKAQNILTATGGNMPLGIIAWIIGGIIMIICSAQFAVMATRYEKINGVVDYAEATCGKKYAYFIGWFMTTIYYPTLTSVLAWVSARYFGVLFGWSLVSTEVLVVAGFFLVVSYALNALSPKLAGYFQVSATVIKLIPLVLMAIVGTIAGLVNGTLTSNFTTVAAEAVGGSGSLFGAVVATAFAYEGWIIATSINSELKNSKRNLPLALIFGAVVVVAIYVLYYIGVAGGASNEVLIKDGATKAFINIFGGVGGTILNVLIVISCLGTLNGLMLGCTRGMYSLSARNEGPLPQIFSQVDEKTNMPNNSSIFGLLVSAVWLVFFYGANLADPTWFGLFNFDSSELPIVTVYALYIPMMIMWIIKEKDLGTFKRFVLPIASICACLFMVVAAVYAHGIAQLPSGKFPVGFYLIIFAVIMGVGVLFLRRGKKAVSEEVATEAVATEEPVATKTEE